MGVRNGRAGRRIDLKVCGQYRISSQGAFDD
jgi:hypothetical protein